MDLKKAYYTELAVIGTSRTFKIVVDTQHFCVKIPFYYTVIGAYTSNKHPIQEVLFERVKDKLNDGAFFLIPSAEHLELEAYQEAQMYHPENFPMDSDESPGLGGMFREDS